MQKITALPFLLLLILLLPLTSCEQPSERKKERPTVLVSVPPYTDFVNRIAKGAVEVISFIPTGANPHIYEATPKEVQRHVDADLWIYLGNNFDQRARQFFKEVHAHVQIVDITQGIRLLTLCEEEEQSSGHHCHSHSRDEGRDLHIWLSPLLAKQQATTIADGLIALIPEKKEIFVANLQAFLIELDQLNDQITTLLAPLNGTAILVSHPAFAYFCRDYHLIQLSIEIEGKDPLPQQVTEILALAKKHKVQSVLTEPQYSNKGAELVAQSLGLPTHMVDPYAENYMENMLRIAEVISR